MENIWPSVLRYVLLDMNTNLSYQLSYEYKRTFFKTTESFLFTSVAEHKSHRRPPPTNDLASVVRELDSAVSSITNSKLDTSISFEKSICLVDYNGHCLNNRSQFSFRVTTANERNLYATDMHF